MSTTIEQIRDEVAQAQARLAAAESKLRELETKPAKWEPKGGIFTVFSDGRVDSRPSADPYRLAGSEYPTEEAAESALPYVTFFKRLCCLAQELNPSGKVGGDWFIIWERDAAEWKTKRYRMNSDITALFETETSAERAAEIMNRDGWQLPTA